MRRRQPLSEVAAMKKSSPALPQYLLHCLAARKLVNQLVEVPHLLHHGIFNLFHTYTTDNARYQ